MVTMQPWRSSNGALTTADTHILWRHNARHQWLVGHEVTSQRTLSVIGRSWSDVTTHVCSDWSVLKRVFWLWLDDERCMEKGSTWFVEYSSLSFVLVTTRDEWWIVIGFCFFFYLSIYPLRNAILVQTNKLPLVKIIFSVTVTFSQSSLLHVYTSKSCEIILGHLLPIVDNHHHHRCR